MDQGILVNAILVQNNIRPAFLVQPINYNEYFEKREKTDYILSELLKQFPELLHTECNSGIIISKQSYKSEIISTSSRLGEILGYPSAKDFEYIISHTDEPDVTINLYTNKLFENPIHILANRCKQENVKRDTLYFENIVIEFSKLLTPYNLIIKLDYNIPIKSLINKILNNETLNEKEIFEINNYIWNISMDQLNEYPFDYTNQVHKGIVLTLLSYCDNDLLNPFYPLQKYPDKMPKVYELTRKWENEILRILEKL
jgi:hypothetical protein